MSLRLYLFAWSLEQGIGIERNKSFWLYLTPVLSRIQALESGLLAPGGVVTEGSAGSTAISLATVASAYGCKCHVVIPDDAAIEKVSVDNNLALSSLFQ